jgi:hypothetical protein
MAWVCSRRQYAWAPISASGDSPVWRLWLLYQSPGTAASGAVLIGAGGYELMLVLVAVNVMSVALMVAIAAVVLAQTLVPPRPTLDLSLPLIIVALGVATVAA